MGGWHPLGGRPRQIWEVIPVAAANLIEPLVSAAVRSGNPPVRGHGSFMFHSFFMSC